MRPSRKWSGHREYHGTPSQNLDRVQGAALERCRFQGKVAFPTRAMARVAAARGAKACGYPVDFYKCQICRLYHLTSQVPRKDVDT